MMLASDNYFKYPTKIDIQILDGKVPFPAVTFCNLGGVSFYAAAGWLAEGRKNSNMSATQRENIDDLGEELKLRPFARRFLGDELYPGFRSGKVRKYFEKFAIPEEEFFVELRAKATDERIDLRTQIELADLDIQEVDGGQYLKCYTVTLPKQSEDMQPLTLEGTILSGNGMFPDMTDVPNGDEYFWWRNRPLRGTVRIFVHQSGVKINPRSDIGYIDVLPGKHAALSFKVKKNIRVGQPHGNCSNRNPFRQEDSIVYRKKECIDMCHNSQIVDQYQSVFVDYPILDGMICWEDIDEFNRHEAYKIVDELWMMKYAVNLCNYTSKDVDGQSRNVTVRPVYGWPDNFSFEVKQCSCYPPCDDTEYEVTANILEHELTNEDFVYANYVSVNNMT